MISCSRYFTCHRFCKNVFGLVAISGFSKPNGVDGGVARMPVPGEGLFGAAWFRKFGKWFLARGSLRGNLGNT